MKKIIGLLLLVVGLGIGAYFVLGNPLDKLVKLAIESVGPTMLQADVSVGSVKMSATDGRGALRNFKLGNPKGFKTDHAFKASSIEVAIDLASLTRDTIVVKSVVIDAPNISYEKGSGGTNFDVIQRNVESYLGASKSDKNDKASSKKVIIESFIIRNAKVNYNNTIDIPLPDIALRNIGKSSGGESAAEIGKTIFGELNSRLSVSKSMVVDRVGGAAASVGNSLKGLLGK
jgi:hypothetical protein